MATDVTRSIEERLNRLERQNRRLKLIGAVGMIAVGTLVLMAQGRPKATTLEAEAFLLKDRSGNLKGKWAVTGDASELILYDATGRGSADLTVDKGEPGLYLTNSRDTGAQLAAGSDGPNLTLVNPPNHSFAELSLKANKPHLQIANTASAAVASVGLDGDGPNLNLTDAQGFQLDLGAATLETASTGETHRTSAASVVMLGKGGKVIWRAP